MKLPFKFNPGSIAIGAILALATVSLADVSAMAQSAPIAGIEPSGLPAVPTTKVLAIGRLTSKWTPDAMRSVMPSEVRETVKLQLAGKIEQWFTRKDQRGVVFVLNIADVKETHDTLEQLPLGQAGLMEFDLIPIGPLAPLGLLLGPPNAQSPK